MDRPQQGSNPPDRPAHDSPYQSVAGRYDWSSESTHFMESPPDVPDLPPIDQVPSPMKPGPRGHAVIAWIFIILGCAAAIGLHEVGKEEHKPTDEDPLGVTIMEFQAKSMVGITELKGHDPMAYTQANETLDRGSIGQRQRFAILAGEMADDDEAAKKLDELDTLINEERLKSQARGETFELSETQRSLQRILHDLYPGSMTEPDGDADEDESAFFETPPEASTQPDSMPAQQVRSDRIATLAPADRDLVLKKLGFFGKLALGPAEGGDQSLREEAVGSSEFVIIVLIAGLCVGGLAALAGFIGLIVLLVNCLSGKLQSGMLPGHGHHGIYAETFAVWLAIFLAMQKPASMLASHIPLVPMLAVLVAFFGSLIALAWPVVRGVPWRQVRQDIGWTRGRQPGVEPLMGIAGYFMALPLLAIGVCMVLGLTFVQQHFLAETPEPFDPTGGPAHPIIQNLVGNNWLMKLQVLVLASIAAPIVEETMFRGVLYRHLRDATRWLGNAASVIFSGTLNAFLFAAIHPQGWVAIPALMALAYGFIIMREWRGTLIPCMLIHGISNGIVMCLVMFILGA